MKIFKYEFSRLMKILIIIGIALCVVGFGLSVYQLVATVTSDVQITGYTVLEIVLLFFVSIALLTILISLLASSYYSVEGETFKTSFGIIKSKYKVADIDLLYLDRKANRLNVHFKNDQYMVIVTKPEWFEDFINTMLAANPEMRYAVDSGDDENDKDRS